jgi:hypothetical protein
MLAYIRTGECYKIEYIFSKVHIFGRTSDIMDRPKGPRRPIKGGVWGGDGGGYGSGGGGGSGYGDQAKPGFAYADGHECDYRYEYGCDYRYDCVDHRTDRYTGSSGAGY